MDFFSFILASFNISNEQYLLLRENFNYTSTVVHYSGKQITPYQPVIYYVFIN